MNPNIVFWIFSVLLLIIALAFLLPPLLRRPTDIIDDRREQNISITKSQLAELETEYKQGGLEKETYLQAKDELEEALYDDLDDAEDNSSSASTQQHSKLAIVLVALFVPLLATGLYLKFGEPKAITESSVARGTGVTQNALNAKNTRNTNNASSAKKPQLSMEQMIAKLEGKLKEKPDNLKGWTMLGRSYMIINRPADAIPAYQKALELSPDNTSLLLQMADALGASNDGVLTGKPEEYIQQALKIEPDNLMGLWLAGMTAKQRGDKEDAIVYWNKVLPRLEAGSKERLEVVQLISDAGGTVNSSNTNESTNAISKASITLTIDLAGELKSKANPDHTVYIYAKAVTGPPMPLAALRMKVSDLPVEVTLDDSMAMMPQLKLSSFKQVTVGARVSVGGTPTKNPGDLYVEQSPVALGEAVSLIIDKIVE